MIAVIKQLSKKKKKKVLVFNIIFPLNYNQNNISTKNNYYYVIQRNHTQKLKNIP